MTMLYQRFTGLPIQWPRLNRDFSYRDFAYREVERILSSILPILEMPKFSLDNQWSRSLLNQRLGYFRNSVFREFHEFSL
jgi:hypothetical protein